MSNKDNIPEQVWITWDDAYPWTTSETGGIPYILDHSSTGRCIHCDPSFVPTGPDDWCGCICHNKEHVDPAPTGKVSEGDAKLAQNIVARLNWMDFKSLAPKQLAGAITAALAAVRKEEREAAKRVVTDTLPAVNFGNGEHLRREVLKALEAAANGEAKGRG